VCVLGVWASLAYIGVILTDLNILEFLWTVLNITDGDLFFFVTRHDVKSIYL
jgi:hypothetical protein